jgi:AraC-like DNA-binding protein/ActR/RegA family two-component response regulator
LPTVPAPVPAAAPRLAGGAEAQPDVLVLAPATGDRRLAIHLNQRGFRVVEAQLDERQSWLAALVESPCRAVVVDVSVSSAQGWRALRAVKQNPSTQAIPVLFYTAAQHGSGVLELDYLTKPIELTVLARALDQHWLPLDADRPARAILVVDDDPETLETHARIVQAHAATNRVLRARNGRDALEILQRAPVDLVLLDLLMPELDGFGVLDAMRASDVLRDVPVIVVTGQSLTAAELGRLDDGVATVLNKGLYSLEETLAHLDAALEHRRKLSGDARRLVRKAMAFLHEHYADPLTRADIARHVGLDEDYLTHCFGQELGVTPITYLNRYRVNQARQLLTHTDKSITVIALDVGFADSGYFSRIFRREVGMSPQAYRRT